VLSKKQIRIQIKNYKNQLRELKGLPPRKVITDSVFRINLRAFGTEVDENNLPHEERVVLEAMGRLDANDKDIKNSDGNAKLRQQGALKTKGGDSINQIVKDYIDENSLDSDTEQDLRDAIIRFVNGGDAYAYMDNIKEREAQNDPDAIRDEEYYNYGYQGAMEYELTDEEISELEQEIGKLNDITQEEYEQIKQEFSDTQAGEGTNRLEDKADSGKQSKEPTEAEINAIAEKASIKPKNFKDLYSLNRDLFGLDRVKSFAAAIAMDRMIGSMAKRAGITKAEMYGKLEFKKDIEENILKADNALFQGTIDGKEVTLRNMDVDVVNGFYSPLEKIISESKFDKLPAKQWIDKFAKGEEAKWTGLTDWLEQQQGSVSKTDIQQYLKENRINVVEVVKGERIIENDKAKLSEIESKINSMGFELELDMGGEGYMLIDNEGEIAEYEGNEDAYELLGSYNEMSDGNFNEFSRVGEADTKFSQYQLEGEKKNYKEVLVTLPNRDIGNELRKVEEKYGLNKIAQNKYGKDYAKLDRDESMEVDLVFYNKSSNYKQYQDDLKTARDRSGVQFKSSHFEEPNILVHLRMNTRKDSEGNKVLFLEEVQSDWGQKGKKEGFVGDKQKELFNQFKYELLEVNGKQLHTYSSADGETVVSSSENKENARKNAEEVARKNAEFLYTREVPTAPFVTDTNAWTKLGLKVALKEAVKQGATKIAWTTGEQQNDRYDLSKQVDEITYSKYPDGTYQFSGNKNDNQIFNYQRIPENKLEDYVGKEVANKIINGEGDVMSYGNKEEGTYGELGKTLSGVDLKVGGKGMKGFYGSPTEGSLGIVGNVAKSLFKQEPKTVEIEVSNSQVDLDTPPRIIKLKSGEYVVQTPFEDSYVMVDGEMENPTFKDLSSANEFYINETNRYNKEIERTKSSTQHSIDITPELKASVEGGLALFQKEQGVKAKGAMVAADGGFVIYALTDPNISTPLHEMAHVFEHYLANYEKEVVKSFAKTKEWNTQTSEAFARGFEKYLAEGKAPNSSLERIFAKFKQWLTDIYNGIKNSEIDIELNDAMRKIYASMLGEDITEKASKSERKAIAEAKIDDIANALKDFLPSIKGVKTSGVTQDKIIDLIAEAVKALVNAGIEINEAIKQVKERLSETFNVDELSDFDIKMTIAKNDLKPDLEKAGISYKQAIFTVNKYLRAVGKEDVITKEELAEALKNKENSKEREGYESREKTSGRSKSYAEGRVPVSEEYKADVERNKVSYTSMDMFKNAEKAIELLSSFGGDIKGLQKAYEYILTVFNDNPYRNPENAVAIELLADRFFARSQEAYKEGDLELSEELADKSNSLRLIAFNTATKAGQWNAALAVFSRAVNPDAFLYFVEGQVAEQNEVTDSNSYTNTARKVKKNNAERATKEFKKKAKEIADQTAKDVAKGSPTVKGKPINSRFTKLKDKGVKRQKDALAKLKKIGFLGSNGLNNEAIEAIGELILSQLEIGIYKAATIAQRIKEMTDGKVTDAHLKEVLDNYKVDYEGKEYSLSELSEQLEKEYKKDNVDAELKKRSERAGMVEKGQKRKSLSELIELQLSENANVEAMTKAIMAEFDLSESAAKALATKYVETYKRVLTERINKQLLKDLGIKNVKEIESKENSGEVKPFHQTLGGKIVGEIMAGALTTGSAVETAFMQKYGFPVLTPNMKTNIRLLALRTNEAKTVLGQKVANRALITYLQSIMPTSTVSILNTLYYVSLLSGITTAAVNTLGNANTLVLQNSENFVQSIVEAAQGEPANLISSVQGKAKVKRAIANFTQSINTFLDIMAKGGGESKYYNLNQKALDSFDSEGLIPKKEDAKNLGLTRAAKLLGQIYYSIPAFINRNLPASDDAFSMSNFNTEAAREVRRNLAKTGLKGKELEDAVFEKIYGTAEIVAMAKLDAIAEINRLGLDPKKEKRLIKRITVELIQSQLDPRVQNAAKAISAENTYRGANRGATGIIGAAIPQNIVFAPFVGTVMRIVEKMVNYIPFYSIARATGFSITDIVRKNSSYVDKLFERKGVLSPKKEGELRAKQIAQVVFTHAVVGIVYALTQIGWEDPEDGEIKPLLEFSGGYLGVPKSQKEMLSKETEMPPYTMRWKGTKYNYKQNPLLVPIGIMFSINSDLKRAGIKELSLTDLNYYATVVSAISMFLLNATPVANMKDFFKELGKIMDEEDVLESSDIGKQFMKSFVAQIPANIAIPNTYKQAFDFLDPQVFQTNTIADVMWKSVNMERIGGLIPAYDYWGRDIERYPAESTYPFRNVFDKKTDVVDKWMIKNNINTEPLNTKTLVLDLDNNTSYTKKKWDEKVQLEQNKLIGVEDNELYEVDAKFRLLTQLEWANMDKTVRQNVRKVIEENLNNVKDEELFETPLVEYTKKEAEKKVRQLFKEERQKYIRKNFNKEKE
jgi:hypothetical protein